MNREFWTDLGFRLAGDTLRGNPHAVFASVILSLAFAVAGNWALRVAGKGVLPVFMFVALRVPEFLLHAVVRVVKGPPLSNLAESILYKMNYSEPAVVGRNQILFGRGLKVDLRRWLMCMEPLSKWGGNVIVHSNCVDDLLTKRELNKVLKVASIAYAAEVKSVNARLRNEMADQVLYRDRGPETCDNGYGEAIELVDTAEFSGPCEGPKCKSPENAGLKGCARLEYTDGNFDCPVSLHGSGDLKPPRPV